MRRAWHDHGMRLLAISAVLALMALMALCLVLLIRTNQTQEFRQQSQQNCRNIERIRSDIRETLMQSKLRLEARDDLDPAAKARALDNLSVEIRRYAPIDCSTP